VIGSCSSVAGQIVSHFTILSSVTQYSATCECGNESLGPIKCEEFYYELLKKDSAAFSKV
jgi:hypothetical protein